MNEYLLAFKGFIRELNLTMHLVEDTDISYFFNKLHEETGEVAEVGSAIMGSENKTKKLSKKPGGVDGCLLEELADTIVVASIIAYKKGFKFLDLLEMAKKKMKIKNDKRLKGNTNVR